MNSNKETQTIKSQIDNTSDKHIKVIFRFHTNTSALIVNPDITIKELLDRYMDKTFGHEEKGEYIGYRFFIERKQLNRYDQRRIKDFPLHGCKFLAIEVFQIHIDYGA